jgi:ABC-type transport system involved in multi-copper enzyme maturation permease subunit
MTAGTLTPARRGEQAGQAGFGRALWAEWTKFRTVRGWVTGIVVAALAMLFVGLFAAGAANIACRSGPGGPAKTGRACLPNIPTGPGGEAVTDTFYFVHQPLTGNGSITVRLTSLTGRHFAGGAHAGQGPQPALAPGAAAWGKAGIIIKQSTRPGSAYAAMMATGGHGVRMQYDYTHDLAGLAGQVSAGSPRWLRLTRTGDTITGYDSTDGRHWTSAGTATLAGLPATVPVGLFATSPVTSVTSRSFGGESGQAGPSQATGTFDRLSVSGSHGAGWTGTSVGGGATAPGNGAGGFHQAAGRYTVTGSGDIAPDVANGAGFPTSTIEDHLAGTFAGLIAVAVIAAMFITAEYRRGLIRTTLAASPQRGRVLAAKAVVIGAVTFVTGLLAAVILVVFGTRLSSAQGLYVLPVSWLTWVRVVAGTAALLAVASIFALALGTLLRRSAAAVTAAIVAIVLPYILGVASVLPAGAAEWVLRVTPAAGFAIQQSVPQYPQVGADQGPPVYFPLAPWAGFAVLCAWTAVAVGLAALALRRRDA